EKVLVLDNIQDPGNFGTIIRSALAFNFKTIIISNDTVDLYNPKVIQASQGSIFKVNVIREDKETIFNLLKDYQIVVTALKKAVDYKTIEIPNKLALVLGNEGNGVSSFFLNKAHNIIKIIHNPEIESLNVATAGAILLNYFQNNS
ncbi:MAG: RNA methyltransferase, partial [Bacillales bacterium]|nr:RNA methyltransferase [Bacillales bacterium]